MVFGKDVLARPVVLRERPRGHIVIEIAIRHEFGLVARADVPRQLYECVQLLPEEALAEINVGPIEIERANGLEAEVVDDGVRVVMVSHAGLELPEGSLGDAALLRAEVRLKIPNSLVGMQLELMRLQRR